MKWPALLKSRVAADGWPGGGGSFFCSWLIRVVRKILFDFLIPGWGVIFRKIKKIKRAKQKRRPQKSPNHFFILNHENKKRNDFRHSSSPIISSINISNSSSQKNTGAKNNNIPISIIRLKIGSYFKSSSKFWVKVLAIQAHRTIISIFIFCLLIGPNAQILIMI